MRDNGVKSLRMLNVFQRKYELDRELHLQDQSRLSEAYVVIIIMKTTLNISVNFGHH